jgi:hypothetical protein
LKRRALSLAELVLAVGFLASVAVMLTVVLSRGLSWQAQSRAIALSREAGRDLLERIREVGVAGLPPPQVFDGRIPQAAVGTPAFPPAPYPALATDRETFRFVVNVTQVQAGLFSVKVDSYWDATHKLGVRGSVCSRLCWPACY